LIILAGPLSNMLLPVLIFWGIFTFVGQAYLPPVMGVPETGSPAATAGLALGDRIQAIDGQPIGRWDEIETALRNSAGRPLRITVLREGRVQEIVAEPRAHKTQDIFGEEIEGWTWGSAL